MRDLEDLRYDNNIKHQDKTIQQKNKNIQVA